MYTYTYIHIYVKKEWEREHDCNSGSVWGHYREVGEKKNDKVWIILKYIDLCIKMNALNAVE
jgi:hypothetical protein